MSGRWVSLRPLRPLSCLTGYTQNDNSRQRRLVVASSGSDNAKSQSASKGPPKKKSAIGHRPLRVKSSHRERNG